eukprot:s78_g23.t1
MTAASLPLLIAPPLSHTEADVHDVGRSLRMSLSNSTPHRDGVKTGVAMQSASTFILDPHLKLLSFEMQGPSLDYLSKGLLSWDKGILPAAMTLSRKQNHL